MFQLNALSSISFPVWHILGFWIYAAVLTQTYIISALVSGWKPAHCAGWVGEEKGMVVFPVQALNTCLLPAFQATPLFFVLCALNTAGKSLTCFSASSVV